MCKKHQCNVRGDTGTRSQIYNEIADGKVQNSRFLFDLTWNAPALVPSYQVTKLPVVVDTYYEYPAEPLLGDLTWPDLALMHEHIIFDQN